MVYDDILSLQRAVHGEFNRLILGDGTAVNDTGASVLTLETMRDIFRQFRKSSAASDWRLVGFNERGEMWSAALEPELVAWLSDRIKEYLEGGQ